MSRPFDRQISQDHDETGVALEGACSARLAEREWRRVSGQWMDGDQAASARLRNFFRGQRIELSQHRMMGRGWEGRDERDVVAEA